MPTGIVRERWSVHRGRQPEQRQRTLYLAKRSFRNLFDNLVLADLRRRKHLVRCVGHFEMVGRRQR